MCCRKDRWVGKFDMKLVRIMLENSKLVNTTDVGEWLMKWLMKVTDELQLSNFILTFQLKPKVFNLSKTFQLHDHFNYRVDESTIFLAISRIQFFLFSFSQQIFSFMSQVLFFIVFAIASGGRLPLLKELEESWSGSGDLMSVDLANFLVHHHYWSGQGFTDLQEPIFSMSGSGQVLPEFWFVDPGLRWYSRRISMGISRVWTIQEPGFCFWL